MKNDPLHFRGTNWIVPLGSVPQLLYSISQWTRLNPRSCLAPIFIQTLKMERKMAKQPYLAPFKDEPSCAIWYDWFL